MSNKIDIKRLHTLHIKITQTHSKFWILIKFKDYYPCHAQLFRTNLHIIWFLLALLGAATFILTNIWEMSPKPFCYDLGLCTPLKTWQTRNDQRRTFASFVKWKQSKSCDRHCSGGWRNISKDKLAASEGRGLPVPIIVTIANTISVGEV